MSSPFVSERRFSLRLRSVAKRKSPCNSDGAASSRKKKKRLSTDDDVVIISHNISKGLLIPDKEARNVDSSNNISHKRGLKKHKDKVNIAVNNKITKLAPIFCKSFSVNRPMKSTKLAPIFCKRVLKNELSKKNVNKIDSFIKLAPIFRVETTKRSEILNKHSPQLSAVLKSSLTESDTDSVEIIDELKAQSKEQISNLPKSTVMKKDDYVFSYPKISHVQQLPIEKDLSYAKSCITLKVGENCSPSLKSLWNGWVGLCFLEKNKPMKFHRRFMCRHQPQSSFESSLPTNESVNSSTSNGNETKELLSSYIQDKSHVMWSEKYCPSEKSFQFVGNGDCVNFVRKWLQAWKNKYDVNKSDRIINCEDSNSSWSGNEDSETDDELCNCLLVTGPPGCGKTSMVYYIAQELGYQVLEVNASSNRSGRHISSRLQEASQSHHVESSSLINSQSIFSESEKAASKKHEKVEKTFFVKSTKPQRQSIANFFKSAPVSSSSEAGKIAKVTSSQPKNVTLKRQSKKIGRNFKPSSCVQSSEESETSCSEIPKIKEGGLKFSKYSLILFDDVDVVFENDDGFWHAVNNFVKTTKKPVILTATRNLFHIFENLRSKFETTQLVAPTTKLIVDHLNIVNSLEKTCLSTQDLEHIVEYIGQDIRKALLYFQFWGMPIDNVQLQKESSIKTKVSKRNKLKVDHKTSVPLNLINEKKLLSDHSLGIITSLCTLHQNSLWDNVDTLCKYYDTGHNIVYNNLPNLLSLSLYKDQQLLSWNSKIWEKPESKNALNISWLSDESDVYDSEIGESANITKTSDESAEAKTNLNILNHKANKSASLSVLSELANISDNISIADSLKHLSGKEHCLPPEERSKKWLNGLPCCDEQASRDLNFDVVSAIEVFTAFAGNKNIQSFIEKIKLNSEDYHEFSLPSRDISCTLLHHREENFKIITFQQYEECQQTVISKLPLIQRLNRVAVNLDYLSTLRQICNSEKFRQNTNEKRSGRFLHYFDTISLDINQPLRNQILQE